MTTEESTEVGIAQPAEISADPRAAARKRIAIELITRHGSSLKRTARRYSLCTEDAEDAYQRGLEIFLTKAPDGRAQELIRWMHTVVKHEALAVRGNRERLLGATPRHDRERDEDWVALIPAGGDGPDERLERRELIARSREALRNLKPAELRALTLLAEGYSYAEIGEITGFSQTKINRCLAEGRERFREMVSRSEDGSRCREMRPLLSTFCDGEASMAEEESVREHLRACAGCRATMRAYRATPGAAAALVPALPGSRSLLERVQEIVAAIQARLPGAGGATTDSTVAQVASAGGTRGAGMAALAKLLTVCAGTAGGAAACVAAGVAPVPFDSLSDHPKAPAIERVARSNAETPPPPIEYEPAPEPEPEGRAPQPASAPEPTVPPTPDPVEAGAVEYTAPPPAPAAPSDESASSTNGSAAGEFGP